MSETKNQNNIKLNLPKGTIVWRNNQGICSYIKNGQSYTVKYGLGDGSSDLIGFTEINVTPEMVGKKLAIFTAIEVKKDAKANKREKQIHFVDFIKQHGGIATFAVTPEDVKKAVDEFKA